MGWAGCSIGIMSCAAAAGIYKSLSHPKIKVDAASVLEVLRYRSTASIEIQQCPVSVLRGISIGILCSLDHWILSNEPMNTSSFSADRAAPVQEFIKV